VWKEGETKGLTKQTGFGPFVEKAATKKTTRETKSDNKRVARRKWGKRSGSADHAQKAYIGNAKRT